LRQRLVAERRYCADDGERHQRAQNAVFDRRHSTPVAQETR
jgi:hypothetical protein